MKSFRVLFVARSRARVESMVAAFQEQQEHFCSPKIFLFCDWPRLLAAEDFLAARWTRADGEEVELLA